MRWVKLIMIGALTLAAMAPAASVIQAAAASPPAQSAGLHDYFEVLYRHDHHDRWRIYGHYHSHRAAHRAADHLRHHGYEVRVHHHD